MCLDSGLNYHDFHSRTPGLGVRPGCRLAGIQREPRRRLLTWPRRMCHAVAAAELESRVSECCQCNRGNCGHRARPRPGAARPGVAAGAAAGAAPRRRQHGPGAAPGWALPPAQPLGCQWPPCHNLPRNDDFEPGARPGPLRVAARLRLSRL
jgi:hypothetical protein